jgi:hypothetical protein
LKLALITALALFLTACASPIVTSSPSVESPSAAISATIAIDCGPFSADIPDCLAIVEAAAKVTDPAVGSRAEVSNSVGLADCPDPADCPEMAALVSVAQVRFVWPTGDQVTVDVMAGGPPPGGYFGMVRTPLRSP